LTDLVMEVTASDGTVQVPRLDFGLNGGTAHHTLTLDLTAPEPAVEATLDWRALGADENLRPFFTIVFPNLFMTGTLDFSSRWQGTGADAARLTETLEGTSTMVVNGGYLVSDPTPQATREVFPTLTLSHYAFTRARIETRTATGLSHNVMHFEAPTVNLHMRGTTDNRTREIDYVMVVDLVENLGLGGLREAIPNKLQSSSQVEIAYIKGTLDDQRMEFLRPKVAKIKETMKSLVSLKPIRKFFMKMSAEEKGAYLQGKVGSFVGGALQPFRFLQEKLSQ
ncbi:MAG: AsmA-like C-terminal region-containing protein, partial [Candidatus Tectimicrobiota bacterium]